MKISFEPGDGSFEIILDSKEPVPQEWNISGVAMLRNDESGRSYVIKDYNGEVQDTLR